MHIYYPNTLSASRKHRICFQIVTSWNVGINHKGEFTSGGLGSPVVWMRGALWRGNEPGSPRAPRKNFHSTVSGSLIATLRTKTIIVSFIMWLKLENISGARLSDSNMFSAAPLLAPFHYRGLSNLSNIYLHYLFNSTIIKPIDLIERYLLC